MGKKQTAVEWLSNQTYELFEQYSEGNFDRIQLNKLIVHATNQAKEMEKQQIIDAFNEGQALNLRGRLIQGNDWYNETYVSDEIKEETKPHSFCETPEEKCTMSYCDENGCINRKRNLVGEPKPITSSQTEMSDESWEGCDGCTEQDEVMYKNGYVKGYNAAIGELPKEISDDEIGKGCDENIPLDEVDMWSERLYFRIGAQWYREQLKNKL